MRNNILSYGCSDGEIDERLLNRDAIAHKDRLLNSIERSNSTNNQHSDLLPRANVGDVFNVVADVNHEGRQSVLVNLALRFACYVTFRVHANNKP